MYYICPYRRTDDCGFESDSDTDMDEHLLIAHRDSGEPGFPGHRLPDPKWLKK